MVKKLLVQLSLMTALIAVLALPAHAGRRGDNCPGPGCGRDGGAGLGRLLAQGDLLERAATEIGLDDETLSKIKGILYEANRAHIEQRAQIRRTHLDLRRELDKDQPDATQVMKLVEEAGRLETDARKNRIQMLLDVRALLTTEQHKRLRQMMLQKSGPGPRGGGRPGPR